MSSKLVRKGLELVNTEADSRSQKRKSIQKEKQPPKKRKRSSGASKDKQRPRGNIQGLKLSSGRTKKAQPVDFTEQNLKYFKKASWKIKKDTYDKILERQNKLQRNRNSEEKVVESDSEEGGLFDD